MQSLLRAALGQLKNPVLLQVTEGGDIACLPGKEVLINAHHHRTALDGKRLIFELKKVMETHLHGGRTDLAASAQLLLRDPVAVMNKDLPPEHPGAPAVRQKPWDAGAEIAPALLATVLAHRAGVFNADTRVAHPALNPVLRTQTVRMTIQTLGRYTLLQ